MPTICFCKYRWGSMWSGVYCSFCNNATQQEIPAKITNPTWYKQDVIFQLTIVNSLGQTIGVGETKVTANGAPFGW